MCTGATWTRSWSCSRSAAIGDRYPDASGRLHAEHGGPQRVYEDHTNGLRVEVHSDHLQLGLEPVEMAEIWSRSQRADFGGVEARVLEPHDLFVHLCLHLHRHSFSRMIWFKDLDLLVRQGRLDWACVRERATAQGCIDSVSLSLELLEAVLGTPLPPEARALAASRARWTRWLQRLFWPTRRSVELELQRRWRFAAPGAVRARDRGHPWRAALAAVHGPAAREAARAGRGAAGPAPTLEPRR